MNDVINRKDAIGAILSVEHIAELSDGDAVIRVSAVNYVLGNLPSAQPERKTGKWIERKHGYWSFVNDKGERDGWIPSYECSECRSGGWRNPEVMNFCPSCGADMRGEHED